jgi:sugar phosphate isomerase/epimerase
MQQGISTNVFLPRRLSPALLEALVSGGAAVIEVAAARHHFDYANRGAVRELANWFRSNNVVPTMHMPLYPDAEWSRHIEPSLNLISESKAARIAAQDEVKRAIESAEQIPFRSCVLHLGLKEDPWDTRTIDDSLTAIEHLKAFASPLGVQLLLENLPNRVATPEHLVEITRIGHFDSVGFCLDVGHAHMADPQPETSHAPAKSAVTLAFEAFGKIGSRLTELHLHDNHGGQSGNGKDEHLWPGQGTVDWAEAATHTAALNHAPTGFLEIAYDLGSNEALVARNAESAWKLLEPRVTA